MDSGVLNNLIVVKRSGQRVAFNGPKIAIAIKSSFDDVFETYDENKVNFVYTKVIEEIVKEYENRKTINVEDIQDIIENILKKHEFTEVYDNFSNYRMKRKASRETYQVRKEHKFNKVIEQISLALQNDKSGTTIKKYTDYGKEISKEYARNYLIDNKYIRYFDEGYIYLHNLDILGNATIDSYNVDLTGINQNNLNDFTRNVLSLLTGIKCDIAGYLNVPNIDELYKISLINDFKINLKENIKDYLLLDGFDEFISDNKIDEIISKIDNLENVNNLFENFSSNYRLNNLFSLAIKNSLDKSITSLKENLKYLLNSLNDIKIYLKNKQTSISISSCDNYENKIIKETIIDILKEEPYYEDVYITFKILPNQNIDNILKVSDKHIYYQNDYEKEAEYFPSGEKVYENIWGDSSSLGKSVNAMTTINLTRLGITNNTIDAYLVELGNLMDQVENELIQSFELIGNKYKENFNYLYNSEYFNNIDLEENQKIRKIIKNGSIEIGYIGLNESIIALRKKFDEDDALKVLKFMNQKCEEFTKENKLNFTLASAICPRAMKTLIRIDRSVYGNILNVTDKSRYTNGHENINIDIADLDYIEKVVMYSSGGLVCNFRVRSGTSQKKLNEIIKKILSKKIPFFKITFGKEDDV